jgi:hypothetical protein
MLSAVLLLGAPALSRTSNPLRMRKQLLQLRITRLFLGCRQRQSSAPVALKRPAAGHLAHTALGSSLPSHPNRHQELPISASQGSNKTNL